MIRALTLLLPILLFSSIHLVAEESKYMGVASCSSSSCHGGTAPRRGTVLQNEYVTWNTLGKHSKGWSLLLGEDSKKIGKHLGISSPEKEPLCLKCHTTYVPNEKLHGEKFTYEDGVGCESCHGASEEWLKSHTSENATHEENVRRGLTDLVSFEKRTRLCLSCHLGNDEQYVNHRLIGAGHPRLSFELDTFSMIQPPHWNYDEDYVERKGEYLSAKAWLVGQVVLASEQMAALLSDVRSKDGVFPELTLFTCYSCHHSLSGDQWKKREYGGGPGELQLNLSSLKTVVQSLGALDPTLAKELHGKAVELQKVYKLGKGEEIATEIKERLDRSVLSKVQSMQYGEGELERLFKEMSKLAKIPHLQYEEAEQTLMALSSILATSSRLKESYGKTLDALYGAAENSEEFDAEKFTALAKF